MLVERAKKELIPSLRKFDCGFQLIASIRLFAKQLKESHRQLGNLCQVLAEAFDVLQRRMTPSSVFYVAWLLLRADRVKAAPSPAGLP
jgi:hypothetical protein